MLHQASRSRIVAHDHAVSNAVLMSINFTDHNSPRLEQNLFDSLVIASKNFESRWSDIFLLRRL